jgi:hypothetical protein
MRVITLEEHFWTDALTEANRSAPSSALSVPRLGPLADDLRDLGPRRLADMDAAGIDVQVLSVAPPGTQDLDPDTAVRLSRQANDRLAGAVVRGLRHLAHPGPGGGRGRTGADRDRVRLQGRADQRAHRWPVPGR